MPSQVLPRPQAAAAFAGAATVGMATTASAAAATAAVARRMSRLVIWILIYGRSFGVGLPGLKVAFFAVPVPALLASITNGVFRSSRPDALYWPM